MTIPGRIERVVLLGFMGSGKSTVAESLARRLEWSFVDFDVEIERRTGEPIASLIDREGEQYFRELEARLTEEVANGSELVIAPGGGWVLNPALLEAIRGGTLSVWLQVSPQEIVRRIREDTIERPLRDDPDPLPRIQSLLEEREQVYRLADVAIPADGRSAESIAFEIEQLVRGRAGAAEV